MGDCGPKKAGCSAGPATYEQGKTGHRCESVATVTVKLWVHDPTIRVKDKRQDHSTEFKESRL